MAFLKLRVFELFGSAAGAVGGWMYFLSASCTSGGCFFLSHPAITIVYGSMLGWLAGSIVKDFIKR